MLAATPADSKIASTNIKFSEPTMGINVVLTAPLEAMVHDKVAAGLYSSPSEVMRDALRLMQEQDDIRAMRLEQLRGDVAKGLASGPSEPWDVDTVKRKLHADRAAIYSPKVRA